MTNSLSRYISIICFLMVLVICITALCKMDGAFVVAEIIDEIGDGSIEYHSSAKACVVLDSGSGRIFYQRNSDTRLALASTTKIVTAITAIENCSDLDTKFKVDDRAIGIYGTSIYLQRGEELSTRELLYGLMLRSGNDAATAIAYHVGGSVEKFCEMMNATAKKAGAINSNFCNPHGLDDPNHYTTAMDLAKITAYALENPTFSEIVKTKSTKIAGVDNERYLVNKNKLLNNLKGCIGVKTGFTDDAGRCLVSACERDNFKVVCVVLNCGPMFEESADMLEAVYNKYQNVEVLEPYHYVRSIPVENGEENSAELYSKKGFSYPLSSQEYEKISVVYDLPESLCAPVDSEKAVGKVKVYYDKHLIFSEEIYTMKGVESKLIKDKLKSILDNWSI